VKPVWVLFDDEAIIAVVEVRSVTESVNWGSVQGQAYDYIKKLNKHSKPTIGIRAQGDKFICWEQRPAGNDAGYECTVPRRLFPIRGTPVSVVSDSLAVQRHFEDVRERAVNGEFSDY
jgi:type I site-specific restriction endonuclease